MGDQFQRGIDREECATVKCHETATVSLRITHEYESALGGTKETELEVDYCDQHAEMWLELDGVANTHYEVLDS